MVTTSANEKTPSVSAPPTPKNDNNLNTDYDNSEHNNLGRSLFDRLSSIHQMQGGSTFSSPAPAPPPLLATNAKQQLEHAVEEESADLRSQMHQVTGGFRLQLDAQRARIAVCVGLQVLSAGVVGVLVSSEVSSHRALLLAYDLVRAALRPWFVRRSIHSPAVTSQ